jgi:hypothetical protein
MENRKDYFIDLSIANGFSKSLAGQLAMVNEQAKKTYYNALNSEIPSFNFRIKKRKEMKFIRCQKLS